VDVARLLLAASGQVRLLGTVVPEGAFAERARLVAEAEAGRDPVPRWRYEKTDLTPLAAELDELADALDVRAHDGDDGLAHLYAERARELALEARLASSAGTKGFGARALRRFQIAPADAARALSIARAWSALRSPPTSSSSAAPPVVTPFDDPGPLRTSSGPEPESLLSRMRRAVGEARVPFTVCVRQDLLALAATGDRTIFVAEGRTLTEEDVHRTVVHELEAHVLPRVRAATLEPKIFQLGTARGADDQEGYAILIEERRALLTPRRRRSLALRHLATARMDAGASFVEGVRALVSELGAAPGEAVGIAERVYRGGDGERAGLGRERVYIASFDAVRDHLAEHPEDEDLLASGQIALEAIPTLRRALAAQRALN
jgi:Domain of unknown function (DUF1704)